jgi:hypothetical protein
MGFDNDTIIFASSFWHEISNGILCYRHTMLLQVQVGKTKEFVSG